MTTTLRDAQDTATHPGDRGQLARHLSPLIQLEMASICAIEGATPHESDAGYVALFHATKSSKQDSVEQMSTVLRLAGQPRVKSGGLIGPVLRLQTVVLQRASTTALLRAMRAVESLLLQHYADTSDVLSELERQVLEDASNRARKRWMILTAHIAQRKDGESSHAAELPHPLSNYFAGPEDRVCMRCLVDRPGAKPALEKQKPYTFVCAACHAEAQAQFPADLQRQMTSWSAQDLQDRVIHKALSRPMKLSAIKEVHTLLAGLPAEPPGKMTTTRKSEPARRREGNIASAPEGRRLTSAVTIPRDCTSVEESSFTDLLFDYRSVRDYW